jgi:hypothetical protein
MKGKRATRNKVLVPRQIATRYQIAITILMLALGMEKWEAEDQMRISTLDSNALHS